MKPFRCCARDVQVSEVARLKRELDSLSSDYAEDGIVRTVLRSRIKQEKTRAKKARSKK
jgi:hypothetical protein